MLVLSPRREQRERASERARVPPVARVPVQLLAFVTRTTTQAKVEVHRAFIF